MEKFTVCKSMPWIDYEFMAKDLPQEVVESNLAGYEKALKKETLCQITESVPTGEVCLLKCERFENSGKPSSTLIYDGDTSAKVTYKATLEGIDDFIKTYLKMCRARHPQEVEEMYRQMVGWLPNIFNDCLAIARAKQNLDEL